MGYAMNRSRRKALMGSVATVCALGTVLAISAGHANSATTSTPGAGPLVSSAVVDFGSMTFTPSNNSAASALPAPAMSVTAAYSAYSGGKQMPSDMQYEYGSLEGGPVKESAQGDVPQAQAQPVWALYQADQCIPSQGPVPIPAYSAGSDCGVYAFISASTGAGIVETDAPATN